MYGIVSDIFMTRPYSFFFSICPEYKIQGLRFSEIYVSMSLSKSETYKETIKEKSTILPYSIHKEDTRTPAYAHKHGPTTTFRE